MQSKNLGFIIEDCSRLSIMLASGIKVSYEIRENVRLAPLRPAMK